MIKVVIVDDEPDAVQFIESILTEYCPQSKVVGKAYSAHEGYRVINETNPDLVMLDVQMPHGSGFDLLSRFEKKTFDVIFITAFNHYAIQAIKFSAVDYILKPVNISELIAAVGKVEEKRSNSEYHNMSYHALLENLRSPNPVKLAIPTSDGSEYLNTSEIIRLEADRSYTWFYLTDNRKHLVSRNLKEYQELLNDLGFFRPHNSHLVNLHHVKKFIRHEGGYIEMNDGSHVPVSRGKKDLFLEQMSRISK
ncbi:MAG: LytTR family DNA-binding domain-containing protein [Bacteroidales bacterium]|nr:LytTR family DNA-binding domain-containing protein [Bacteroidales bacterium]